LDRTIASPPTPTNEFPAFIVNDLSKDDRFNQLPFVTGAPFLKFYAGTPLITKRGIPIGSLFIVDDYVRNGLNKEEIRFMGTMAATIMRHMEMGREVEEHRRGMKMSRGLASFVEGRAELMEDEIDTEDGQGAKIVGEFKTDTTPLRSKANSVRQSRAGSMAGSVKSLERKEKEYSAALLKAEESIMDSITHDVENSQGGHRNTSESLPATLSYDGIGVSSVSSPGDGTDPLAESPDVNEMSEASTLQLVFSRAANLIREAFEVDGGSVFYDAQKGFDSEFQQEGSSEDVVDEDWHTDSATEGKDSAPVYLNSGQPGSPVARSGTFQRTSIASTKRVEILGYSTPLASSIHGDNPLGDQSFTALDEKSLHRLLRRYPRGKLWTFDQDGCVSSSEEENKASVLPKRHNTSPSSLNRSKKRERSAAEAKLLLHHFSGVRQLLFVPLWDASRSRWLSGNFTWSTEPTRILSKQQELAFLTAFGNSVMAECNRLDAETADQKKGDFIGSISHELRSPLHGILASAEFLGEEIVEGFSKGLVETIDSCGRTLLDTM
jgi:hypothetical protein